MEPVLHESGVYLPFCTPSPPPGGKGKNMSFLGVGGNYYKPTQKKGKGKGKGKKWKEIGKKKEKDGFWLTGK